MSGKRRWVHGVCRYCEGAWDATGAMNLWPQYKIDGYCCVRCKKLDPVVKQKRSSGGNPPVSFKFDSGTAYAFTTMVFRGQRPGLARKIPFHEC